MILKIPTNQNDENTGTVNFISAKSIFKNFTGKVGRVNLNKLL